MASTTSHISKLAITALTVTMIVGLPLTVSAATTSTNTTVTANIVGTLAIDSLTPANVGMTLDPTGAGVVSSASQTVQVSSNNASGFKLYIKDADATLSLGASFSAHASAWGSATALANNTWGYAIPGAVSFDASYSTETNNSSSASKWVGITASDQQIKDYTSSGIDSTVVWYAARATTAIAPGTYADTVTYTATTNP